MADNITDKFCCKYDFGFNLISKCGFFKDVSLKSNAPIRRNIICSKYGNEPILERIGRDDNNGFIYTGFKCHSCMIH
jgi:hypothetical protein